MKGKISQFLSRFSLYDTTGLAKETRKNLRLVILGVVIGNVSFTITGGTALTGYIKALGASDFVYSVLLAMPYVAKFMQLVTSYILERTRKRRELMLVFGLISRLSWIPVALVPYFVPAGQEVLRIWVILVLVLLLSCMGGFIDSSFNSLLPDIVPMRIRGRYFAARQRMMMVTGILAGLLISLLLDAFTADGSLTGYTIVFVLVGIFGAGDIICFFWVTFPPMAPRPEGEKRESFPSMFRGVLTNRSYMKVIALWTAWAFAVNICGPFYNVHMLGPMGMSYTEINILSGIVCNLATLLFAGYWGKLMDRYGNKAVIRVFTLLGTFVPALWLFTNSQAIWMVAVAQFLAGMLLPAADLAMQNIYLYQAPEKNRSMYYAVYFCVTQMVGVALAYSVGGWLVDNVFLGLSEQLHLSVFGFEINQYQFIFQLSVVLRLVVSVFLLRMLPEDEADCHPMAMVRGVLGGLRRPSGPQPRHWIHK